jgi:hypothetical protein
MCTPERGNLLRNLANKINMAVEARVPESNDLLLEVANDIKMTITASEPEGDDLLRLKRLLDYINAVIGANLCEREDILRNLADEIEMAIETGVPTTNQEEMKSLDEKYCDVTGETMDLGLAGTFSLHRVFSCHLTSYPQVASEV